MTDSAAATPGGALISEALTVNRPPTRWPGLGLAELWQHRTLGVVLARRHLKARYQQTLIGAGWAIIQPVILMLALTVFFGIIGRMPRQGDVPFAVFFMAAIVIWHPAARVLSSGATSVIQNAALIGKVYFPRALLPIAAALLGFVDLLFGMIPLGIVLAVHGVVPGWPVILVPVLTLIAFATILGLTFWLSALNASYRDIGQALPFITQVWFFATPIIYAAEFVPEEYRALYFLNPMALVVTGYRWGFAGLPAPPFEAWLISPLVAGTLLISGYLFFRTREPTFDDVI